jgi:hypothetical protein
LNFVWNPGSECRTQPTVISNPLNAFLFHCFTPAQRLASLEQRLVSGACRQCTRLPTQLTARETQSRLIVDSYQPLSLRSRNPRAHRPAGSAVCIARAYSSSRVIPLHIAAPNRCMSPPQITLPHETRGAVSSCRGGQSVSQRSACCHSTHRLCLCFLSHLPTIRHPFFSTAVRDTQSRLKRHSPFT